MAEKSSTIAPAVRAAYVQGVNELRAAAFRVINDDVTEHEQSVGQVLCRGCRRRWPCPMAQLREAVELLPQELPKEDQ